ncbi:MAG: hypothetical protein AB8F95_18680 [Bacteroidia bacterium]
MKRILKLAVMAVVLAFTMSSCLTMEDHFTFNKDGSGSMKYVVDMSEMKGMMRMMMDFGEGDGELPMDLPGMPSADESPLASLDGISNFSVDNDMESFKFGISFDFENSAALNQALKELGRAGMAGGNPYEHPTKNQFSNTFSPDPNMALGDQLGDQQNELSEMMGGSMDQLGASMGKMSYHVYLNFAKPVQAMYTAKGVKVDFVDEKGKQIKLTTDMASIKENPDLLSWTVVTK